MQAVEAGDGALARRAIDFVRRNNATFCAGRDKLEVLLAVVERCAQTLPAAAAYIEAGVAMGGSAMVIAAAKPKAAPLHLYDVFEMLPPPTAADGEKASAVYAAFQAGSVADPVSRRYYDNRADLLPVVRENFAAMGIAPEAYGVQFHKGLFEDTVAIEGPVAFCHVDADWYDSVNLCLDRIAPHIVPGGMMVFDDYNSFEGCRKAVDEWLAKAPPFEVVHKGWTLAVQRRA